MLDHLPSDRKIKPSGRENRKEYTKNIIISKHTYTYINTYIYVCINILTWLQVIASRLRLLLVISTHVVNSFTKSNLQLLLSAVCATVTTTD